MSVYISVVPQLPVTPPPPVDPPPAGEIRTLKKWEELDVVTYPEDARYNANGVDQFGLYNILITDATGKPLGDWSNNNQRSKLTASDMAKIAAMQPSDGYSIEAKMSWFTYGDAGTTGAPMVSTNWKLGAEMIANFYPGQKVEVLERRTMFIDWNGVKRDVPMVRLRTFTRADFGKTWASHPHLIHKVTAVSRTNSYREQVKGTVYSPVALSAEFDFAGNFVPAQWWIFERYLV